MGIATITIILEKLLLTPEVLIGKDIQRSHNIEEDLLIEIGKLNPIEVIVHDIVFFGTHELSQVSEKGNCVLQ